MNELKNSPAQGMIITVQNQNNYPGDFYGMFKTEGDFKTEDGFAGFRVQSEDWFVDSVGNKVTGDKEDILDKWRKFDHLVPWEVALDDGTTVPFASLLFTANSLQQDVALHPMEGVVTIAAMRTWLPTAAHALQTLAHLQEMFGWYAEEAQDVGK